MHRFLLLLVLLSPVVLHAQIVNVEKIDSFTVADLQAQIDGFGAGALISAENAVDLYRVTYMTEYLDSMVPVSGAMAVPRGVTCPSPLIVYHHGTVARRENVPSYGSAEGRLSTIIAATGYATIAPDYIGLGSSDVRIHPYVHTFSQAHSAINQIRATRQLADSLDVRINDQLLLLGYSQGGHATMATHKTIQEMYPGEFTVTASAPMAGPQDVAGVQADVLTSFDPYPTPGYLPYIVLAYKEMYPTLFADYDPEDIFVPPYDSLMPALFYGHQNGMGTINGQSTPVPRDMVLPSEIDSFLSDPNHPLQVALEDNTLIDWAPQAPVHILHCSGDDQVTYANAVVADSAWRANGAPDVQVTDLGGGNHTDCVPLAVLAARGFLFPFNNQGIDIVVDYDEATNSFSASLNGDDITDGYTVEWTGGVAGTTLTGVQSGVPYRVDVTSDAGCTARKDITLESVLAGGRDERPVLDVAVRPNPARTEVRIDLPDGVPAARYTIMATDGRIVLTGHCLSGGPIDVRDLAPGVYHLSGEDPVAGGRFVRVLVKQ